MAQQSPIPIRPKFQTVVQTTSRYCRMTIFVMQFFYKIFSKRLYWSLNLHKEVIVAILVIIIPISYSFYPRTAQAGLFSFIFDVTSDEASAKVPDVPNQFNSQNSPVLKVSPNNDFSRNNNDDLPVLASGNALMAEIGPAGTLSEIQEPVNTQISIYVVRSGDTLSEIAGMFDVSVNTILWANGLTKNSAIREGQTLVILPISGIKHIVKKGETIKGIVQKYKVDLDEVLQYNDITLSTALKEGDIILVPDAEIEASVNSTSSGTTPGKKPPTYAGYYMRPIVGGKKSQGIHGHNGVDLAAPVGTPIYASAGGTVIAVMNNGGWNGGYGNYVIISHNNGTQTLYAHNSVNLVSRGQTVKKGDVVAKIGMTGKTTGPHVHFEIRGAKNPF